MSGRRCLSSSLMASTEDTTVRRKGLHVAILVKAEEVACDLIDAGAQMMSRLVDGRDSLHLAAQMDMAVVISKNQDDGDSDHLGARTRSLVELMNELVVSISLLRNTYLYLPSPRNDCCRQVHVAYMFAELVIRGIENGQVIEIGCKDP